MWKWRLKQKRTAVHSDLICYLYDIWQAHKAALFQRIEGEDFNCLELALKSYLHVHSIKMTAFNCRHKIHQQGEQKKPKLRIISKWKWRIKKNSSNYMTKRWHCISHFSHQVRQRQMTSPPAWNVTQVPQISTVGQLCLTERAQPRLSWPQPDVRENWPKMAVERWLWCLGALALNNLCGIFY